MSCEKEGIHNSADNLDFILYEGLTIDNLEQIRTELKDDLDRMSESLGLEENENTYKIHIWNTEDEFYKNQKKNTGKVYAGSTGYVMKKSEVAVLLHHALKETIEHELAHILSYQVNPEIGNNPRWLWETIAIYESGQFVSPKLNSSYAEGLFPSLAYLSRPFNDGGRKIYDLGYMIGEYIVETHGKGKYIKLIESNGDIESSLNVSVEAFEEGWKKWAIEKYL